MLTCRCKSCEFGAAFRNKMLNVFCLNFTQSPAIVHNWPVSFTEIRRPCESHGLL